MTGMAKKEPLKIIFRLAGRSYGPDLPFRGENIELYQDAVAHNLNKILLGHGVASRYMGEFPYSDPETGAPRLSWVMSMASKEKRDAIASTMRQAITETRLQDILVLTEDATNSPGGWDYTVKITGQGPSILSTADAYKAMAVAVAHIYKRTFGSHHQSSIRLIPEA